MMLVMFSMNRCDEVLSTLILKFILKCTHDLIRTHKNMFRLKSILITMELPMHVSLLYIHDENQFFNQMI